MHTLEYVYSAHDANLIKAVHLAVNIPVRKAFVSKLKYILGFWAFFDYCIIRLHSHVITFPGFLNPHKPSHPALLCAQF